jgi:hypothetical protein
MTPPILRFQTKKLITWINQENAASDEQQDSIQQLVNHFRPGGIGASEIVYMDLYPNLWVLVNRMKITVTRDIVKYHKFTQNTDM